MPIGLGAAAAPTSIRAMTSGGTTNEPVAEDKRLELAYNAGKNTLSMLDTSLGNVRTRANTLLATAALFTSFATGIGLINTDAHKGVVLSPCKGLLLLLLLVALGICALFVLWPIDDWPYGPSAKVTMEKYNTGDDEGAIRKFVIGAMIDGIDKNKGKLKARQRAFQWAALLLVAEVGLLVAMLTVWK